MEQEREVRDRKHKSLEKEMQEAYKRSHHLKSYLFYKEDRIKSTGLLKDNISLSQEEQLEQESIAKNKIQGQQLSKAQKWALYLKITEMTKESEQSKSQIKAQLKKSASLSQILHSQSEKENFRENAVQLPKISEKVDTLLQKDSHIEYAIMQSLEKLGESVFKDVKKQS